MTIPELTKHLAEGDDKNRTLEERLESYRRAQAVAAGAGIITVVEFPMSDPPLKFDFIQERIERLEFEVKLAEALKNRP